MLTFHFHLNFKYTFYPPSFFHEVTILTYMLQGVYHLSNVLHNLPAICMH
jgi:hypothetical protein